MRAISILLACLVCASHGQLDVTQSQAEGQQMVMVSDASAQEPMGAVAAQPKTKPASGSSWLTADVQRVLTLMCIIGVGKLLQGRFPNADAGAIQKLLLQFLVPATLFKGLSKEKIEASHLIYIQGGFLIVFARIASSVLVSYAAFGTSSSPERATLRRTAIFEISTMASALSVLPFVKEFLGDSYVGLGGMVDLPMKLYMLIIMPALLSHFGDRSAASTGSGQGGKKLSAILLQLMKDPITMSLVSGILFAMVFDGAGTAGLGFAGKALDTLAGAQSPVLFLLIGLKLKFESSTPLFSVVLLLGTQGVLLIMMQFMLLVSDFSPDTISFMISFAQGAPSVVGMGVITSAVAAGVQGYSTDFAFDIVGLAFPISSFMQCFAGIFGKDYKNIVGIVGVVLVAIAVALRVIFSNRFRENAEKDVEQAAAPPGTAGIELRPPASRGK